MCLFSNIFCLIFAPFNTLLFYLFIYYKPRYLGLFSHKLRVYFFYYFLYLSFLYFWYWYKTLRLYTRLPFFFFFIIIIKLKFFFNTGVFVFLPTSTVPYISGVFLTRSSKNPSSFFFFFFFFVLFCLSLYTLWTSLPNAYLQSVLEYTMFPILK